jgi:hypothetical protein
MIQKTYCFTIKVVGTGIDEADAFQDAQQAFEMKLEDGEFDEAEFLHEEEDGEEEDEDE